MDCQMPVMDGYEASRTMRKLGCEAPILALTASALDDEHQRCLQSGMNGVITKPVSIATLFKEIKQLLEDQSPIWSQAYQNRLRRQLGQEPSARVQQAFLQSLRQAREEMGRIQQDGDLEALGRLSHKLRSSALTCGAIRLGLFCDTLTNSTLDRKDQDLGKIARTFDHHLTETINRSPAAMAEQLDQVHERNFNS